MDNQRNIFTLEFNGSNLMVEEIRIPGQVFFNIKFSTDEPPLNILRATDIHQEKFWTSVPEGRQKLAASIGRLIDQYYQSLK